VVKKIESLIYLSPQP